MARVGWLLLSSAAAARALQWPEPGSGGQRSLRDTPDGYPRHYPPRRVPEGGPRWMPHPRAAAVDCAPVGGGVCEQTYLVAGVGPVLVFRPPHTRGDAASGVALAHRLAGLDLTGASVVEVGAGSGLASATAAMLGAVVTATVVEARTAGVLQRGLTKSCAAGLCPRGPPSVIRLDWHGWYGAGGSPLSLHSVNFGRRASYVVAADAVTPGPACLQFAAVCSVMRLLAHGRDGRLVYAHTLRDPECDAAVAKELHRQFDVIAEEHSAPHPHHRAGSPVGQMEVVWPPTDGHIAAGDVVLFLMQQKGAESGDEL